MKEENTLDILMYLFEHYMDDDNHDQEDLEVKLIEAGFATSGIEKAFTWLEGLAEQQDTFPDRQHATSMRIYLPDECRKLDVECRGFLLFLEQVGILDAVSRELVIDRVMALETDELSLEQLKWVILMVLFNRPGHESEFAWMEDLVYEEIMGHLH